MKKGHLLTAYILIGLGSYFLIKQLHLSLFSSFYGWPTIFIIIGISFLLHSYVVNDNGHLFAGVLLVGSGVHLHGLENYAFWYDHWSIYMLIVGLAYTVLFFKTKKGLIFALILLSISFIMIFSITLPDWFSGIYWLIDFIDTFWPVMLIAIGLYFLMKK